MRWMQMNEWVSNEWMNDECNINSDEITTTKKWTDILNEQQINEWINYLMNES